MIEHGTKTEYKLYRRELKMALIDF